MHSPSFYQLDTLNLITDKEESTGQILVKLLPRTTVDTVNCISLHSTEPRSCLGFSGTYYFLYTGKLFFIFMSLLGLRALSQELRAGSQKGGRQLFKRHFFFTLEDGREEVVLLDSLGLS